MDVLAHGLWTNTMYRVIPQTRNDRRVTRLGIVFGVLPDLVAFAPFFAWMAWQLVTGQMEIPSGRPEFDPSMPLVRYASAAYDYSHSLVIFIAALLLTWGASRRFPWFLLGWAFHILIDIFSHTSEFYATPFLFPLSGYKVSAVSWSHPLFMAINYGLLLLLYLYLLPRYFRRDPQPEIKNPAV